MVVFRFARPLVVGLVLVLAALVSSSPVLAGGSDWKVGYYTPSGRALSMASADVPAAGLATFNFTDQTNTALLVTDHGSSSLRGDDLGKTITATFDISGATGAFTYFGEPDGSGVPANTRLFFETNNAGGFDETHFWWSNPTSQALVNGTFTIK